MMKRTKKKLLNTRCVMLWTLKFHRFVCFLLLRLVSSHYSYSSLSSCCDWNENERTQERKNKKLTWSHQHYHHHHLNRVITHTYTSVILSLDGPCIKDGTNEREKEINTFELTRIQQRTKGNYKIINWNFIF